MEATAQGSRAVVPVGEAGYSLPELLVVLALGLLAGFGAMTVLVMAQRVEPQISERAGQLQQGRFMVERIVRELRQGEAISNPTPSGLEILTRVRSDGCGGPPGDTAIVCSVTYQCGPADCVRAESEPDGTGAAPATQIVTGIAGPNVFGYESPAAGQPPDYVSVELRFPDESGSEAITIADGARLRNWSPEPE